MDTEVVQVQVQEPDPVNTSVKDRIAIKSDLNGKIENTVAEAKDPSDKSDRSEQDEKAQEPEPAAAVTPVPDPPVYVNGGPAEQEIQDKTVQSVDDALSDNAYIYDVDEDVDVVVVDVVEVAKEDETVYVDRDYLALYQEAVFLNDICREEFSSFKSLIVSHLSSIRQEYVRENAKTHELHHEERQQLSEEHVREINISKMERKTLLNNKDKVIKQRENESKALKTKQNEMRSEIIRMKQLMEKNKRDSHSEKQQIIEINNKLKKDNKVLADKLTQEKKNVLLERADKLAVSDKNQEFLRKEKAKISLQLDKQQNICHSLETELSQKNDSCREKQLSINQYINKLKASKQSHSQQENIANKAIRERDAAIKNLQSKGIQFKNQQHIFNQTQIEIETIRKQSTNQLNEIKVLHESMRRKAEKERQFDDMRKKLANKEKKLEQREKELKGKSKKNNKKKNPDSSSSSPSKTNRNRKSNTMFLSNDPLNQYRNILPFHWISIFLVAILMIAIAQRK